MLLAVGDRGGIAADRRGVVGCSGHLAGILRQWVGARRHGLQEVALRGSCNDGLLCLLLLGERHDLIDRHVRYLLGGGRSIKALVVGRWSANMRNVRYVIEILVVL